ncbi:MAG: M48 family peptidase [Chloroflexota bacterium]|nr:MAG: M48 family peptidase [Chloroflexota bacterium]
MPAQLSLTDITIDVVFKPIKNVHLSVHPPDGHVRISAPGKMALDTIRVYAITRLEWIRRQRRRILAQARETARDYVDRESHYVWGKRYLLKVVEIEVAPSIELRHSEAVLATRPGTSTERREAILAAWYRDQVRRATMPLIAKWEPRLGVSLDRLFVQRMKTRWGSCNPLRRSIRLNTELAKKPPECLEYIVVHELAHLLVPNHNERFHGILDASLPGWRQTRQTLNSAPLAHEAWTL